MAPDFIDADLRPAARICKIASSGVGSDMGRWPPWHDYWIYIYHTMINFW